MISEFYLPLDIIVAQISNLLSSFKNIYPLNKTMPSPVAPRHPMGGIRRKTNRVVAFVLGRNYNSMRISALENAMRKRARPERRAQDRRPCSPSTRCADRCYRPRNPTRRDQTVSRMSDAAAVRKTRVSADPAFDVNVICRHYVIVLPDLYQPAISSLRFAG